MELRVYSVFTSASSWQSSANAFRAAKWSSCFCNHFYCLVHFRGCLHEKTCTSLIPRDDFLISYRVYMMTGSFHISLLEGRLHVNIHV